MAQTPQPPAVSKTGMDLRLRARRGDFAGSTTGQAPGFLQGNVVILPKRFAGDFLLFCANNPKPCPVIGLSSLGVPGIPELGEDLDIRTDVPCYRIYENGRLSRELTDISGLWADDFVTFVLGCSFTFEDALMRAGHRVRHVESGRNVAMYKTGIETVPGGVFGGPLVVSMRPFPAADAPSVFDITARYPHAHGAPVHWGDPAAVGIVNLDAPDYGDPPDILNGEIPVFWACGVTPQAALERAKPDICITHAPGSMLVTDASGSRPPAVDFSLARIAA